jgi:YaaC-like Protein
VNKPQFDRFATLPTARASTGFMRLQLDKYPRVELRTSCNAEDEIFSALSFYCDVEDAGKKLVHDLTGFEGTQCNDAYDLFQAFIRQGQTFFSSARHLAHRASPLFYYYAFLNLAKAHIALRKPDLFANPLKHGLTLRYSAKADFNSHVVTVVEPGVFPELYELLEKQRLPRSHSFRIIDLLGYLTDISFEYQDAGFGVPRIVPVKSRLFVRQNSDTPSVTEAWPVLAVGHCERLAERSQTLTTLLQTFEEVNLEKGECERMFGINAVMRMSYRFFQGRRIYRITDDSQSKFALLNDDAREAIESLSMPNVFPGEDDFLFSLPLSSEPTLKMDEFIAGYLILFYLGSLVRYHPDYLERILRSKEAWIIQRFSTSCAVTLLRHASVFLLGQNRVFEAR